jgi:hypothetical protein
MKKVELRMNEELKYKVIKKLVETKGNKLNASIKLNCSIRQINRLIDIYKKNGKSGFVHGNRGRKPSNAKDDVFKENIVYLYETKYYDANISHFIELLKTEENIIVSDTFVLDLLFEHDILSPKARRKTKKKLKNKLEIKVSQTKSMKAKCIMQEKLDLVDNFNAHPRRPRSTYAGELHQYDASEFKWFNNIVTHLHLSIDDAEGKITGAYFDHQETLNGYQNVLYQTLVNFGIPCKIFSDKRTVFEYKRKNESSIEKDTFTQFSYACHQLGIEIETSSLPQAKGRVERLNQTLQSRLPIELRLAGITTIEEANEFLKSYIKKFNKQFSIDLNSTKNAYEIQPNDKKINQIIAKVFKRKVDSGHSIKYMNKYYLIKDEYLKPIYLHKGTEVMVIEAFDKNLYCSHKDQVFILEEIPTHYKKSKELDLIEEKPKVRKQYIPPMSHPWKKKSFDAYLAKQKHREEYGANV